LVGSWLTPDRYQEGGASGYKAMGRSHLHDRSIKIIINTINYPHVHVLCLKILTRAPLAVGIRSYTNTRKRRHYTVSIDDGDEFYYT
jgi:hypothetical protein